jgi:hypothetical protein
LLEALGTPTLLAVAVDYSALGRMLRVYILAALAVTAAVVAAVLITMAALVVTASRQSAFIFED